MHQAHDVVTQLGACPIQGGILILVQMDDDLQLRHIMHFFYVLLGHCPDLVYQFPAVAVMLLNVLYSRSCNLLQQLVWSHRPMLSTTCVDEQTEGPQKPG